MAPHPNTSHRAYSDARQQGTTSRSLFRMEQMTPHEMERNNKKAANGGLQDRAVPFLERKVEIDESRGLHSLAFDQDRTKLPFTDRVLGGRLEQRRT